MLENQRPWVHPLHSSEGKLRPERWGALLEPPSQAEGPSLCCPQWAEALRPTGPRGLPIHIQPVRRVSTMALPTAPWEGLSSKQTRAPSVPQKATHAATRPGPRMACPAAPSREHPTSSSEGGAVVTAGTYQPVCVPCRPRAVLFGTNNHVIGSQSGPVLFSRSGRIQGLTPP